MKISLPEKTSKRFWNKVDKTSTCWNWTASTGHNGYGRFRLNGKLESPHVLSYKIHNSDYVKGRDVCHTCDNRSCVNPDHLFLGSRSDNMIDCSNKNRNAKGINHYNAKLCSKDIPIIRNLLESKVPIKRIAELFKVSATSISAIKSGKTWKHVP